MKEQKYVWYCSYGSNLNRNRFLCYIQGGTPRGSEKEEVGCRDKTLPKKDQPFMISYPLYFKGYSSRWGGSAAVIGHKRNENYKTLGRMYLITEEQFMDVVKQENNGLYFSVDLAEVRQKGSKVFNRSRYGCIMHLGDEGELPIFTFTSHNDMSEGVFKSPSAEYLETIIIGINQTYNFDYKTIVQYFLEKNGVKNNWNKENIFQLVKSVTY
ncbi:hypothetical protein [Alteribacter populi]|uniref:hypothetical protein n=1 Tax=Alteribacter populi TaxID=2011011 RepID=UPI000BBB1466|nr:hypothetical protein [Alteribacter populi]